MNDSPIELNDFYDNRFKPINYNIKNTSIVDTLLFNSKNSAYVARANGMYEEALKHGAIALDLLKPSYNQNPIEYYDALSFMIELYFETEQLANALPLIREIKYNTSLNKRKDFYGRTYGKSIRYLASYYSAIGKYQMALQELKLCNAVLSSPNVLRNSHPELGINFLAMAYIYAKTYKYNRAEYFAERGFNMIRKGFNIEHQTYISSLRIIAIIYQELGLRQKSLAKFQESLKLNLRIHGKNHPLYIRSLNDLASVYFSFSQFEKAASIADESLELTLKMSGENCRISGDHLFSLAVIHYELKNYETGLNFINRAIKVTVNTIGKSNIKYNNRLAFKALIYGKLGNYDEEVLLLEHCLKLIENITGDKSWEYGETLYFLSVSYKNMKRIDLALPLLNKSLTIIQNVKKSSSLLGKKMNDLAFLYEITDNLNAAHQYFKDGLCHDKTYISNEISYAAETIQKDWLAEVIKNASTYNSFFHRNFRPNFLEDILSLHLLLNHFQLESKKNLFKALKNADFATLNLIQEWKNQVNIYANQISRPISMRTINLDSISNQIEQLENLLAMRSQNFSNRQKTTTVSEIQESLDKDELIIFFNSFQYQDENQKCTDSIFYVANIIYPTNTTKYIFLFEEKKLSNLLNQPHHPQMTNYRGNSEGIKPLEKGKLTCLYNLIWKPLIPHLTKAKKVNILPTGLLHRLNLGLIPIDSSAAISDRYKLHIISSFQDFVSPKKKYSGKSSLLVGGLVFGNDSNISNRKNRSKSKISIDSPWISLEGTMEEVDSIKKLLDNQNYNTLLLTKKLGTESNFKNHTKRPHRIIHLATHGFFFAAPEKNPNLALLLTTAKVLKSAKDPLLRSGLIMAGANTTWIKNQFEDGQEDGILTAYEISHLDLSETELVVLSACETALGDIVGTEGVYGLQRGFKMAGVKYIIMSLWKVPDRETQEMMVIFYKKWLVEEMDIPDAFQAAQGDMRKKYTEEPYKWAGFVLVE